MAEPKTPPPPSDDDLDKYIRTRYALLGIDISVLPKDDPKAVMDQKRLLANGRSILRQEVIAADFKIDPQFNVPMPLVPQFVAAWTREEDGR
jgi:hypothetical protein